MNPTAKWIERTFIAGLLGLAVVLGARAERVGTDTELPLPSYQGPVYQGNELCVGIPETAEAVEPAIILPAKVSRHIDGDTLECVVEIKAIVRLKDCWAAETRTTDDAEKKRGREAAQHLANLAPVGERCVVYVPIEPGAGLNELFTFGRVLGRVYVDDVNLSERMVEDGFATRTKEPSKP